MFNFKKLFGKAKKDQPTANATEQSKAPVAEPETSDPNRLPLIAPADNAWGIELIDLRPITLTMISTSKDPQMATNAVSYGSEDGTVFWGQQPPIDHTFDTTLSFPIDGHLAPGVLFKPVVMEHKWAIYFDGENLIFVRSWQRRVHVVAKTIQENDQLIIKHITGSFMGEENDAFTKAILNFLLISHCINEVVPAPLAKKLMPTSQEAGLWAFSLYGKMVQTGTFDEHFLPVAKGKLRSLTI
jgi:hypothetical protein